MIITERVGNLLGWVIYKMKRSMVLIGLLMVAGMLMTGCGETSFDETSYFNPNWTPEGKIYARKVVSHYKNEWQGLFFGGQKKIKTGEDTYYVTMDTGGNNEELLAYPYYPYFSPKGTYVAYVDSTSTFHVINRSNSTEVFSFQPTTEAIAELDWGPNEDKLVYRPTGADHLFVIGIDGNNKVEIGGIDAVEIAWRVTDKIVFFNRVDSVYYLAFAASDATSLETTSLRGSAIGSYPNYYSNSNFVFSYGSNKLYKINVTTNTINLETSHQISSLTTKTPINTKLSPNNLMIAGGFSQGGIWIINIDGSGFKEIK